MNRNVNLPIIIVAVLVLAVVLFGIYKISSRTPSNPGAADIPAKQAGDDKPAPPPPDVGPVPGQLKR